MEIARAVSVLVEMGEDETGFQLTADLLFHGMGELDAIAIFQGILVEPGVLQGIEGQAVLNMGFYLIEDIVDAVVQAAQLKRRRKPRGRWVFPIPTPPGTKDQQFGS